VSNGITRRAMLAGLPGCLLASVPQTRNAKLLPRVGEFVRYIDPVTETPVVRLTNPSTSSFLPAPYNRFVSTKDRFLIFSSDRAGGLAPFQLDLRNGILTQLAKPHNLLPESLCLNQRRNALYLLDGDTLQEVVLANRKSKIIAEGVTDFCEIPKASGGEPNFFVIRERRLEATAPAPGPLAENVEKFCLSRPAGDGCLFLRQAAAEEHEFWYAPFPASAGNPVLLAKGKVSNPAWMPDGESLLFLRELQRSGAVTTEIRSVNVQGTREQRVAPTTQFAAFSPNADASVFVGASRSKAQPTVLLLLPSVQREFTLCEHRASHPAKVAPVFSPDSKRVYFQSDHDGKSALYSVNVEALVEPTPA
jgi:hypothetical protein